MFKKLKRLCSFCLTVGLLLLLASSDTYAQDTPVSIDAFLSNTGVPDEIISSMPLGQKQLIYETLKTETNVAFNSYDTKDFVLNSDDELQAISESMAQPRGGLISSSDLTLSVVGFRVSGERYSVYPSFVWHKAIKLKNDSFAMSMYSGWEAVPGSRNLRVHLLNSQGEYAQYVDLSPNNSSSSGYSYKVPSSTGALQGMYEGHAYYYIDKVSSSASPRISLYYAHDYSTSMNVSYSVNVGSAGSISFSGNSTYINEMSDNFSISFQ